MDRMVAVLLGFIKAASAGEDEIGKVDQLLLQSEQHRRRELEFRSSSIASNTTTSAPMCREKGSIIGV